MVCYFTCYRPCSFPTYWTVTGSPEAGGTETISIQRVSMSAEPHTSKALKTFGGNIVRRLELVERTYEILQLLVASLG